MRELVPPTVFVEAWAVADYITATEIACKNLSSEHNWDFDR